jgi:site-specific recombinase XerD
MPLSNAVVKPVDGTVEAVMQAGAETRRKYQRKAKAHNSLRAYKADLANLKAWCEAQGLPEPPLPMSSDFVATYLAAQYETGGPGSALATLKHRAAAISWTHRCASLENPCDSEAVRGVFDGIARTQKERRRELAAANQPVPPVQKRAKGLTQHVANKIEAAIEQQGAAADLRDFAIVLVGRDLLARASEVASLTVDMVGTTPNGMPCIKFERIKTGDDEKPIVLGADAAEALARWLEAAHVSSGPLFRAIGKGKKDSDGRWLAGPVKDKGIGPADVSRAVKKLAGADYSAHSLRRGMAEDLAAANFEMPAIMAAGGWKTSRMVALYTQDADAEDGAVAEYHRRRASRRHK